MVALGLVLNTLGIEYQDHGVLWWCQRGRRAVRRNDL
jgi:hypothetical protein